MIFKFSKYIKILSIEISFQLVEKLIRIIFGLIIVNKLSSYLGPEEYGSLLFIESNYLLFLGLSGFGLSPQIVKIFSQKKHNFEAFIYNGLILSFLLSMFFFIIFNIWNYYFLSFSLKESMIYVSFLLFLNPIYFIEYYYTSLNKLRINSTIRLISYIICFVLKIVGINNDFSINYFIWIIILEVLITCLFFIVSLKLRNGFFFKKIKVDFKIQYIIFKNSLFIFLYGLGINLFSRIDILMIQEYLSLDDLGNYTASFKIVAFLYAFPVMIANTFYPRILKLKDDTITQKKMYFFSFWTSVILFTIVYLFREDIMVRLFDEQFDSVQTIFNISVLPIILIGLSSTFVKEMYKNDLQINLFVRSLFGISLNILLNFILIPLYGVIGVAYATVISIFCLEILYDFIDNKTRRYHISKLKSIFDLSLVKSNFKPN